MKEQRYRFTCGSPSFDPLDLNLKALDVFVQIAESGGISKTARRMGLTQSAVSQIVSNLEQVLGVQLFDRQVRPLALTPSGVVLLEKAKKLLLASRDAIQAVRQPSDAAFPKLNLCLVETIAGTIGPDLIAGIQNFAMQWSIRVGLANHHAKALLLREADVIISPDALEDEINLEKHEILKEPFIIALPNNYNGPSETLYDLTSNLPLIRYSSRSLLGRHVERHLRRLRIDAPGRIEFDTSDAVLAMVTAQMGWSILTPSCALLGHAYWSQIRFIPLPEPSLHRRIFVIARHGELGDVPKKIAEVAIASLTCLMQVKFANTMPWVLKAVSLPKVDKELTPNQCIACNK